MGITGSVIVKKEIEGWGDRHSWQTPFVRFLFVIDIWKKGLDTTIQLMNRSSLTGRALPWGLYLSAIGLGLIGTILFYLDSLIPPICR